MENNSEINEDSEQEEQGVGEENSGGKVKLWLQDNLRILISILIVVLIAGGIYSYSKRTESPAENQEALENEAEIVDENGDIQTDESLAQEETSQDEKDQSGAQDETVSPTASSQETENSFIETAAKGDSQTTLARAALADYLEKNTDSSLTAEHKIYIEDFLRKNAPDSNKRIFVGTSVEFSKDLINSAIEKSKTLNENQLQNLHKYVLRVPSLL